jgi:hypothetical protein
LEMTGHGHWSYIDDHRHWIMTGHGHQSFDISTITKTLKMTGHGHWS